MSKIEFYTNPMSRGQIARWALHEAGAEYEQHILEYGTTMKAPEYLAINPWERSLQSSTMATS